MLNALNRFSRQLLLENSFRLLRHVLLVLMIMFITINILWDEPVTIITDRYIAWGIYLTLFLIVIYVNMYLLVPRFLLLNKTKKYLWSALLLMIFFIASVGTLQSVFDNDSAPLRTPPLIGILSGLSSFLLFIVGLTSLQFFKFMVINQQKIEQLENVTMEVELANLQSQINPHFLFNMLNNTNIMIEEDSKKASDILIKFNSLLKYQIEKSNMKSVKLNDEISFLQDYLNLEKLRRDRFHFTIEYDSFANLEVPPLLFAPFVENAVKHNPENDAFIAIRFSIKDEILYFECKNNKSQSTTAKKEGGLGLINIKQRLNLLFKEMHTLQILDEEATYSVKMKIKL